MTLQLNPQPHYRSDPQYRVMNMVEELSKMPFREPIAPFT